MKTYKVEIVRIKNKKVMSTIGKNLSKERAEKREMTGLSRIDRKNYFVKTIEENKL